MNIISQNIRFKQKPIREIKKDMVREFKKKYGYKYDDNNPVHVKNISKMVNDNSEKYLKQYQEVLSNFDMDAMFIKNEYYK